MNQKSLWAPWRLEYIRQLGQEEESECFLCDASGKGGEDADRQVVYRNDAGLIVLNRYPYTNGHLLAALHRHVGDLTMMDAVERAALMELTVLAERLLVTALAPQGVNIGINVGRCAGAGLPGHLHVHVVPRWGGDTNFMTVVGQVRVIPQAREQIYQELMAVLPRVLAQVEE